MSEQQQDNEPRDVDEPAPTMPPRFVVLTVDAKESSRSTSGAARVRAMFHGHKVPPDLLTIITQRSYEVPAGGKAKLRIAFVDNGEKAAPKGTLVIEAARGKLSPSRIELDGKKHEVTVDYVAPDETIRVSIRASLQGYVRGKVHLYLEA